MKVHTQPSHKVMVTGIGRRVITTAEETYFCPTDFGAINQGRSVRVIRLMTYLVLPLFGFGP